MQGRIIHRPGVGTTAGVAQRQTLQFRRLFIDQPLLIVVERGTKVVGGARGEYVVGAGEAIVLAGGRAVDITNRPAADGSYRARWLAWDPALVASHARDCPTQPTIRDALPLPGLSGEFMNAFGRAVDAIGTAAMPDSVARHRALEMLLWIGTFGARPAPSEVPTPAVRVRRLIAADLAREWSAAAIASALAMSEATLRRRLAEEATSLSEILADARLSFALNLLQCTAEPVTQIAYHAGYLSPSHFAARFRRRFGFSPSAIRRQAMQA